MRSDPLFTKGPADVLDHATSEIAMDSKLGIDATRKLAGEGFKRPWPPLIKMDETFSVKTSHFLVGGSPRKCPTGYVRIEIKN
jgi:4-hydroxy-3-polyprenylbenzoate decarboxylase